jgi:hypothetical protein
MNLALRPGKASKTQQSDIMKLYDLPLLTAKDLEKLSFLAWDGTH